MFLQKPIMILLIAFLAMTGDALMRANGISAEGIKALKFSEGLELAAYKNFKDEPWTIGYGHTGVNVYEGLLITQEQADEFLKADLKFFEENLNDDLEVPLYQWQYDALINFAYNIGSGALSKSTLMKNLNAGGYNKVPEQLDRWVYVGKVKVTGQVNRRNREGLMWVGVGFEQYSVKNASLYTLPFVSDFMDRLTNSEKIEVMSKINLAAGELKESRLRPVTK